MKWNLNPRANYPFTEIDIITLDFHFTNHTILVPKGSGITNMDVSSGNIIFYP